MFDSAVVTSMKAQGLIEFLADNEFLVEKIDDNVLSIKRENELPVFMSLSDATLFFEVDLGNITAIASEDLYFKILDLNTEILPVSIGFDTTNSTDPRLVLVESRELNNLNDNEILSVLDAMELATDKLEALLTPYMK